MAGGRSGDANPLRCAKCKGEDRMQPRLFPWRKNVAFLMKCTILLWPVAVFITEKPDYYECPACGHRKGSLWV
jgi:hypothetical protein